MSKDIFSFFMKKTLGKNVFLKGTYFIILFLCLLTLENCATLSQKAQEQNIKIVTSPYMVDGMQNVHAYTTESSESINDVGIIAANNAADGGWSNITILVKFVSSAGGYFVYNVWVSNNIYEISYWK